MSLPAYPAPPALVAEEQHWHRLHPLSPLVRAGRSLLALVIPVVTILDGHAGSGDLVVELVVVGLVLVAGVVSWLVTRWRVEGAVLRIDSGLVRRSSERIALRQIQAIDLVAPGLARFFHLAELRVRTAGASGKGGRLSYLPEAEAESLRVRLLALAQGGAAEDTPAPPERVLARVPVGRLVGSLLLGRSGLILATFLAAAVLLGTLDPGALAPAVSGGAAVLIGAATVIGRRVNSGYHFTLAEADDGFRVRGGLVQTTAETIPVDRIQAVRLVEPVLWRPFGWCQVLVDVAGRQRRSRENGAEARSLRQLLPVGARADADRLVARVVPSVPGGRQGPPARARWKSPLRYRQLSWACDDRCALTTSGRLRRITDVVPLAKIQSFRRVEGPLQRRLGLASVHLDTAGRGIDATIRDRDRAECDAIMDGLPARARRSRAAGPSSTARSRPPRPR